MTTLKRSGSKSMERRISLLAACGCAQCALAPRFSAMICAGVAEPIPHPAVLRILVAIHHRAAEPTSKEDAEIIARHRGHGAQPFVLLDDLLGLRE